MNIQQLAEHSFLKFIIIEILEFNFLHEFRKHQSNL